MGKKNLRDRTKVFETDVSGEIAGLTEKTVPVNTDFLLIEDSADSNSKKYATVGAIVALATGGADTALSNLASVAINESLISDADSTDDLGSSSIFWANAYLDKVHFSATASIDGTIQADNIVTEGSISPLFDNVDSLGVPSFTWSIIYARTIENRDGLTAVTFATDIDPDTDSTKDLGGTSLRWANLNVDAISVAGDIIPNADSSFDLGDSSNFFAQGYVDKVFFEPNAFLQYENIFGGKFISGQSSTDTSLRLLSKNDTISMNVRSGGALYGMVVLANTTHGVTLSATKAGVGGGHFVLSTGTDLYPGADSSNDLGSSSLFWANIYTDLLHLSSTINIDGSETGVIKFNNADIRPDSDSTRDLGATDVVAKDQSQEGAGNQNRGFNDVYWVGQTFTSGSGVTNISQIDLYLRAGGGDTAINLDIFLADGNDLPIGNSLGQVSIPAIVNASYEWKTFTFGTPVAISASTKYCILWAADAGTSGFYEGRGSTSNPYANGVALLSTDSGSNWAIVSGVDFVFRTFTKSDFFWAEGYIDKLFLNNTATLDGATAGHIKFVGDLVPTTDDTEWVGEIGSPFKAIKGLVIKDTTDGKHYKVEVISGTVTATALD